MIKGNKNMLTLSLLGGLNNTLVCLNDDNDYDIESLRD